MGRVLKRGRGFEVEFEARGLTYRQKAGSDEAAARALLARLEGQLGGREISADAPDWDLDTFFSGALAAAPERHTPSSCRRLAAGAADFLDFLRRQVPEAGKVSQMTPRVMEQYKADLRTRWPSHDRAQRRRNLRLVLVRELFEHAVRRGVLHDNPCLHVRFFPSAEPACLSFEDIGMLMGRLSEKAGALLQLVLRTGIRRGACLRLNVRDVDEAGKCIKIKARAGQPPQEIPLDAEMGVIWTTLTRGFVWEEGAGHLVSAAELQEMDAAALALGCPAEGFYTLLRNTFARRVLGMGVGFGKLYRMMGERDIAAVVRYAPYVPPVRPGMIH